MATDDPPADIEDDSPFQAESEFETTMTDVYEDVIERWLLSPLRVLWSDYRGRLGLIVISIYILLGTVGVIVYPDTELLDGPRYVQAFQNSEYPLGTNNLGEDLFAKVIHGTPKMLKMIIAGALFGNSLGLVVGLFSGYLGGNIDKTLMTLTDTVGSIPGIPLLLILGAMFEPQNAYLIGIMVSINGWTGLARGIRSQVLPLRKEAYVEASQTMGQSTSNILIKQILPDLLPLFAIRLFGGATAVVNASVVLYFLGILPVDRYNWGYMLDEAYNNSGALTDPSTVHWLLVPIVTITGLTFALTMLAQAFDQVFNPRVRARHEARRRASEQEQIEEETSEDYTSQMEL